MPLGSSPDGRHLYVANNHENYPAVFNVPNNMPAPPKGPSVVKYWFLASADQHGKPRVAQSCRYTRFNRGNRNAVASTRTTSTRPLTPSATLTPNSDASAPICSCPKRREPDRYDPRTIGAPAKMVRHVQLEQALLPLS